MIMADDINKVVETIAEQCRVLIKTSHGERLKIDVNAVLTALHKLQGAIASFEELLRKAYGDEEKLGIPAVKEKWAELVGLFQKLREENKTVWRYYQIFKKNEMVTPEEYKSLPDLYKAIIVDVDAIIERDEELQELLEKEAEELKSLQDDLGKKGKTSKLRKMFDRLRGAA